MQSIFQRAFAFIVILYCLTSSAYSYSGGTGDVNNPYQITNVSDWNDLMQTSADWGRNFILTADVNLQDVNVTPVGNSTTKFTGVFDGNGYKIVNVDINQPSAACVGLFGYVSKGTIKNLGVEDVNYYGMGLTGVGGLAGVTDVCSVISNCYSTGNISTSTSVQRLKIYTGGLVGSNNGTIVDSCSVCFVKSSAIYISHAGGLAGDNSGSVLNSSSNGSVVCCAQSSDVGGLFGYNKGTVSNSYSTGSVYSTGSSSHAGGLIGSNLGSVENSYAAGSVFANLSSSSTSRSYLYTGGLIGYNNAMNGTVSNSYAIGTVLSTAESSTVSLVYLYTGGLVGYNYYSDILNCYSTGGVTVVPSASASYIYTGGLVGSNNATIASSFWDIETSGQTTSAGGTGKTTAEMKNIFTYLDAGWEFADEDSYVRGQWIARDNDCPLLIWQIYDSVLIPDLKGLTVTEAESILASKGILIGKHYSVYDTSVAAGLVCETRPERGVSVYAGLAKVNLLVARDSKYFSGDGTAENPYQISSPWDWQALMNSPEDWGKCFVLVEDLDMSLVDSISPIGNYSIKFTGVFYGDNHKIKNLDINQPGQYVGLFGYLQDGVIKNLCVEDVNVIALSAQNWGIYLGGMVGYNDNGTITNCYIEGCINNYGVSAAGSEIGGLVGYNRGTISKCYVKGNVINKNGTSDIIMGGLTGINKGAISQCYTDVQCSDQSVGGASSYYISCYVAGLAGWNNGTITACYSTGSVFIDNSTTYYDCRIAGLVVSNENGIIMACYSNSVVTTTNDYIGGVYGLTAYSDGTTSSSFWNTDKTWSSWGGKGLTTTEMKNMKNYQNAEWAGYGWVMRDGIDYPHLEWEGTGGVPIPEAEPVPLSGSGTEADPYQIWTAEDFASLSYYTAVLDKNIKLMTDVNLARTFICPVGNIEPFTGVFDGDNHTISNADVNQIYVRLTGLFGSVGVGGKIINLHIEDINIVGSTYCGGLAGYSSGEIVSCSVTGKIQSYQYCGGLVGGNVNGIISDCSSNIVWSGYSQLYCAGGLIGYNKNGIVKRSHSNTGIPYAGGNNGGLIGRNYYGSVSNCYATGDIGNKSAIGGYIGGLIGDNYGGTVSNCYAVGAVGNGGSHTSYYGGLTGANSGTIIKCFATGAVSAYGNYLGGLAGSNSGTIQFCYSLGSITTGSYTTTTFGNVGGLVGSSSGNIEACYSCGSVVGKSNSTYYYFGGSVGQNSGAIKDCYAIGDVNVAGKAYIGGLTGYNNGGTISNCYSIGKVKNSNGTSDSKVGGLIGHMPSGAATSSFWDKLISGKTTSAGGTGVVGKTTAEMQTLSTFTNAGWDFMYESVNGPNDTWRMCSDGVDYPRLSREYSSHGDFDCPDGTDVGDLFVLSDQWLLEKEYVNFVDFTAFANSWDGDTTALYNFAEQWLEPRSYTADISPWGGDGNVNILDFAVFAEYWVGHF